MKQSVRQLGYLSGTVRVRQSAGESQKFQKLQISCLGVATAWGHSIELKSLVRTCFICLKSKKLESKASVLNEHKNERFGLFLLRKWAITSHTRPCWSKCK